MIEALSVGAETVLTLPDINLAVIATLLGILTGLGAILIRINRLLRKWNRFSDDWYGTPASDGHEEAPGVIARLDKNERDNAALQHTLSELAQAQSDQAEDFKALKAHVDKELSRNGGSSTKDAAFETKRILTVIITTMNRALGLSVDEQRALWEQVAMDFNQQTTGHTGQEAAR